MLEILALSMICKKNANTAKEHGRKPGGFIAMTIALWFGLEIIGLVIGITAELGVGAYILALVMAIIGGVISVAITNGSKRGNDFPQNSTQATLNAQSNYENPKIAYCMSCGTEYPVGQDFCGNCGCKLNPAEPVKEEPLAQLPTKISMQTTVPIPSMSTPVLAQAPVQASTQTQGSMWVFVCYDNNRVAAMSMFGNTAKYYSKDQIVSTVKSRFSILANQAVDYASPQEWNAPNITATETSFEMDSTVIYDRIGQFLFFHGYQIADIQQAVKASSAIPNPNLGILLICVDMRKVEMISNPQVIEPQVPKKEIENRNTSPKNDASQNTVIYTLEDSDTTPFKRKTVRMNKRLRFILCCVAGGIILTGAVLFGVLYLKPLIGPNEKAAGNMTDHLKTTKESAAPPTTLPTAAPTALPTAKPTPLSTPKPELSAIITFENTPYNVSIGEISTNADGNITVAVNSPDFDGTIPIRKGILMMPIEATIVVDGKKINWDGASMNKGTMVFEFKTGKTPEKIRLYPNGKENDPAACVTFDAVTKAVLTD